MMQLFKVFIQDIHSPPKLHIFLLKKMKENTKSDKTRLNRSASWKKEERRGKETMTDGLFKKTKINFEILFFCKTLY